MSDISNKIASLVAYGIKNELLLEEDAVYVTNRLLNTMKMDEYNENATASDEPLEDILAALLDDAVERGIISDDIVSRDLFDTELMAQLMPRPSEVIAEFSFHYQESPAAATNYYYNLSKASDYIRTYRIKKDIKWISETEYGPLDITINLSKPEKDPKAIAAALKAKASNYPKCLLCKENEGYAGRGNHPARGNHRIIPIVLNNENFFLQYSPYVYYNEHCIVFNSEHTPMKIDHDAFAKLLDFVTIFPHYFIGSNADLPIVGGSILTHDHFQGGNYEFPMAKAPVETELEFKGFEDISAGIVKWPMSCIRLNGPDKNRINALADKILAAWREYTDEDAFIYAYTDGTPHNTITPIARRRGENYELDLVLRNNITTEEHPLGVYHPHAEHHHIKKENIGLIEVMGLAVLPARLKNEIAVLKDCLKNGGNVSENETIAKHEEWVKELKVIYGDFTTMSEDKLEEILRVEIGKVYCSILGQAGVYKRTDAGKDAFIRFADKVNSL
ncbi:MAG: UDP-glucose--hexose-1-phosphate uridylyltransferase [Lachnospiraceae bacterium]|nr:UDP-glucose--hexose-1-phosphate uridylyltransferase [Lachnospiraceae bacterium]